ncbi:general substrate transporter [Phialemonium atrogriseum]|uniref:General substrate transporter n=1 Tax=Phialemonium atrogriseum TaxID=1093897 RepID=A0AAJ0BYL7_9PEZI|nr:general substrate transporter [Phialemonium atrogriseum]KAK1764481.1 general substrate transporter [Phialemonium atrogriseum]
MAGAKGNIFAVNKQLLKTTVPKAWLAIIVFNFGALLFGFDTAMFGALQVTPSWLGTFGTIGKKGEYEISAIQQSLLNSIPWIGKIVGVIVAEPINEKFGYKTSMVIASTIQVIGVIVEMVGRNWGIFCAGRTIVYGAVGYIENVVPLYIGEIVYPESRGFFIACYSLVLAGGQIWANGAVQGIAKDTTQAGWLIVCGQQLIPVIFILAGLKWCPSSPRWLLQKGRDAEALRALASVRTAEDNESGWVQMEILGIQEAIEAEKHTVNNSWFDLFKGTNLRRTWIASLSFIANQWTGNQFVTAYAPTLYVLLGRKSQAFIYTIIKSVISLVAVFAAMLVVDKCGRRFVVIFGCIMQCIFLYVLAGMGMAKKPSTAELNTMVAAIQLFIFFCRGSVNAMAFLIPAEVSSLTLRKKTMAMGCAVDVVAAFVVTFVTPYLIKPEYANLSSKVGFIFGGFTTFYLIWAIFFLPELKNRSLEEVDELFNANLWAWQFSKYETKSLAGRMAQQKDGGGKAMPEDVEDDAVEMEHSKREL